MKQGVAGFAKSMASPSGLMSGGSLKTGAYIVKTLPGSISNTLSTLSNAISFAKSHGIEVPPDATAALN
jgi:hypothetical protein